MKALLIGGLALVAWGIMGLNGCSYVKDCTDAYVTAGVDPATAQERCSCEHDALSEETGRVQEFEAVAMCAE